MPASLSQPDLPTLIGLFYDSAEQLGAFEPVSAPDTPPPFRMLLDHNYHMTKTVERFHKSVVNVQVLEVRVQGNWYSRKILLSRQSDDRVVQFGIMRVNFNYLNQEIRREIESQSKPLGRILIRHGVLREIRLATLWKVMPGADLQRMFGLAEPEPCYGRTAMMDCNGEAAIELLEIVTPENTDGVPPTGAAVFQGGTR